MWVCPGSGSRNLAPMTKGPKSFFLTPVVHDYLLAHAPPLDDVQRDLIAETEALGDISMMQIAPEQGAFMALVTRLIGARRAVEVGTFTGYSSLSIARALPDDGTLLCCDVSEEWTAVARKYWERAGVDGKIELRIAPAVETLRSLPVGEKFDLAFIDADKENYPNYYEEVLARLRPGGVILVDNTLWMGAVVDPEATDDQTNTIREFNDAVVTDDRVDSVILTVGDGLTLVRKR
jgi:caffeoyl-CoA O-methyltransferase